MADPSQADLPADQEPVKAGPEADPPADQEPSSPSASGGSSRASSAAAEPFFADPGSFDADREAEEADEAPPLEPVADELIVWTPERIRRLLTLQGNATHALVGVADTDWVWKPAELDMVCGPLCDYANRVPQLQALAGLTDQAAMAAGFTTYLLRSWRERTRELQRRAAEPQPPPQPITGRAPADDLAPEEVPPEWTAWNQ